MNQVENIVEGIYELDRIDLTFDYDIDLDVDFIQTFFEDDLEGFIEDDLEGFIEDPVDADCAGNIIYANEMGLICAD